MMYFVGITERKIRFMSLYRPRRYSVS